MIVFPAIDLYEGRCVRLMRGDFDTAHEVADSPLAAALLFAGEGATWAHIVDLDGARSGRAKNRAEIAEILRKSDLMVQLGGGIRDMRAVDDALALGVSRVVIGSAALHNPQFVKDAVRASGDAIAVGIDAAGGMVSVNGWTKKSGVHYLELAQRMEEIGVQTIIFTDIARDGMLTGPNLNALQALSEKVGCRIIASGGVRTIEDIRALSGMRLYGAICGKSLYQGTLDLHQAITFCGENA